MEINNLIPIRNFRNKDGRLQTLLFVKVIIHIEVYEYFCTDWELTINAHCAVTIFLNLA